jgi:hypothetical protein
VWHSQNLRIVVFEAFLAVARAFLGVCEHSGHIVDVGGYVRSQLRHLFRGQHPGEHAETVQLQLLEGRACVRRRRKTQVYRGLWRRRCGFWWRLPQL